MTSKGAAFLDLVRTLRAEECRGQLGAVGTDVVLRNRRAARMCRHGSYVKENAHSTVLAHADCTHCTQKEGEWWRAEKHQ